MANRKSGDEGLLIRFFRAMEPNPLKTLNSGKPEFDEVECISIVVPGSSNEHVAIITDEYKERFKEEYAGWKASEGSPITGTPLSEWTLASKSFVEMMKLHGIRSVEDLANASEAITARDTAVMTMRAKAQAWLATAGDTAAIDKITAERDALLARIAELEAQPAPRRRASPAPAPALAEMTDEELEAATAP